LSDTLRKLGVKKTVVAVAEGECSLQCDREVYSTRKKLTSKAVGAKDPYGGVFSFACMLLRELEN